jgi:hypothetical protein
VSGTSRTGSPEASVHHVLPVNLSGTITEPYQSSGYTLPGECVRFSEKKIDNMLS